MPEFCLGVFAGAFTPGTPLFYVACVSLILVCVGLIVFLLLRKPKFTAKPQDIANELIGLKASVTETIDSDAGTGLVSINGQEWAARAVYTDDIYEAGTNVTVVAVEGVKVVVKGE